MPTPLIDTHCHLGLADFDLDRAAVIGRAEAAGVARAVAVGQRPHENERALALAREHPFLAPAAGQHPEFADEAEAEQSLAFARAHAAELAGIGEVGLDYFRAADESARAAQGRIFERFVRLALETGLGLTVHSRSAGHYAIDLLLAHGGAKAILHAFDGKHRYAEKGAAAGLYFSIPPSIVRSRQKQDLVRALPLSALCLESDAPVLGPDRAARNEPMNVTLALDAIAALKGVDREQVAAVTTGNARAVFRLGSGA